jgi:hypothetical protein
LNSKKDIRRKPYGKSITEKNDPDKVFYYGATISDSLGFSFGRFILITMSHLRGVFDLKN